MRRRWLIPLVFPLFGFECEYFDDVVVPASDTQPPMLATRMWIDGDERLVLWPHEQILDAQQAASLLIAPAVYDSGGAMRLDVQQGVRVYCHDDDADPEEGQQTIIDLFPRSENQGGGPGSTVSNGLFLVGDVFDLTTYETYCYSGFDLVEVAYFWEVSGRDFAGNLSQMNGSVLYYRP
ncbi:MAG: hypothetical protein IAG13_33745 [Deltaproteobacteria bacterium]|nr:hypothetical protein [Nannocystaceae bacterium]